MGRVVCREVLFRPNNGTDRTVEVNVIYIRARLGEYYMEVDARGFQEIIAPRFCLFFRDLFFKSVIRTYRGVKYLRFHTVDLCLEA